MDVPTIPARRIVIKNKSTAWFGTRYTMKDVYKRQAVNSLDAKVEELRLVTLLNGEYDANKDVYKRQALC